MWWSVAAGVAGGGSVAGVLLGGVQAEGVSGAGWSGVGDHRGPAPARGESSGGWCGPDIWGVGHGRWGARLTAALGASV